MDEHPIHLTREEAFDLLEALWVTFDQHYENDLLVAAMKVAALIDKIEVQLFG